MVTFLSTFSANGLLVSTISSFMSLLKRMNYTADFCSFLTVGQTVPNCTRFHTVLCNIQICSSIITCQTRFQFAKFTFVIWRIWSNLWMTLVRSDWRCNMLMLLIIIIVWWFGIDMESFTRDKTILSTSFVSCQTGLG